MPRVGDAMQRKRQAQEPPHHALVEAKLASFQCFYAPSTSWVVELPALLALVRPAGFLLCCLSLEDRRSLLHASSATHGQGARHWDLGDRDKQFIRYTMFRPA